MRVSVSIASVAIVLGSTSLVYAEDQSVMCTFQRICNNFLACEDVTYKTSIVPRDDGAWVFRDDTGDRPAIRVPELQEGGETVAFVSHASLESTMMITVYSGGAAQMIDVFEEPGFWSSHSGTCEAIQ